MEVWWNCAAGEGGFFCFREAEDITPEQFAPLTVRQPPHHPVRHRHATDAVDLGEFQHTLGEEAKRKTASLLHFIRKEGMKGILIG